MARAKLLLPPVGPGLPGPPIFAVFFLGVFFKQAEWQRLPGGARGGLLMGVFRLAIDTPVALGLAGFEKGYPEGSFLWIVNNTYFQYYSVVIFLVSSAVMVLVSLLTRSPVARKHSWVDVWHRDRRAAAAVAAVELGRRARFRPGLAAIAAAYLYFTG